KRDETEDKRLLGLGLGGGGRVRKQIVNGAAHARDVFRSLCLDQQLKDKVAVRIRLSKAFAKIVVIEEEHFVVIRVVEDANQREFEVRGPEVACQRDALAGIPAEFVRQLARDDAGRALMQEGLLLVFGNPQFGIDLKKLVRPDG